MATTLHGDVASAIGQQVEQMILQAKKDSETRVKHELGLARSQLQQMEELINQLDQRVKRCAHGNGGPDPSQMVDRDFLRLKVQALEQKWGAEVKALKQDLHRTILAHNHNSDLMRHHRDALDEARRRLDAHTSAKPDVVEAQIHKVDQLLRQGQAKQRALEQFSDRLTALEQQVAEMLPGGPGFPGMMPGMQGMAPMMGQSTLPAQQREPAAKRAAKKDGASEPPTEEEVRQRLLQAARGGSAGGDGASSFNAEAPVFVPRGATSATETAATTSTTAAATTTEAGTAAATTAAKPEVAAEGATSPSAAEGNAEADAAGEPTGDKAEKPSAEAAEAPAASEAKAEAKSEAKAEEA